MLKNIHSFKADEKDEYQLTCEEIKKVQMMLQNNERFFNMVDDELLVNYSIHEQNALMSRYQHLLKRAKSLSCPTPTKETVAGVVK